MRFKQEKIRIQNNLGVLFVMRFGLENLELGALAIKLLLQMKCEGQVCVQLRQCKFLLRNHYCGNDHNWANILSELFNKLFALDIADQNKKVEKNLRNKAKFKTIVLINHRMLYQV